jgi:uncharacterized membrane protein YvbJ
MEEVKQEQVQVENVEVVEEKKKGFSKKKILAIGGVVAGALALGVIALTRGKNGNEESQTQFGSEPTLVSEPVIEYTDVEYEE